MASIRRIKPCLSFDTVLPDLLNGSGEGAHRAVCPSPGPRRHRWWR